MSKIVIVEDNERSRYLLEQFLSSRGHEVVSAENGVMALEIIRKDPPNLVVSDIMMPEMNGYRLCREIKKDRDLRHIPLIFYTATFVEKEDERLGMSLGAFGFVLKPAGDKELDDIICRALDLSQEFTQDESQASDQHRDLDNMLDMYDNSVARKLAEKFDDLQEERAKLAKSELRLKEAQEITQVGHWEFDLKTDQFLWSDQVCRIFGFKPQEKNFSQELMLEMVHPEDRDMVGRSYQSLLKQMMPYNITYRILMPDDAIRFINEYGQTLCDDLGTPISALGTVQNITEQKTVELELERHKEQLEKIVDERTQQLREAHEELVKNERLALLGQLATTVSHELRTPLGTIRNALELVDRSVEGGSLESIPEKVQLAKRNVVRCDRIISELLEFSNIKTPEIKRFKVGDKLKETLNDLDWPADVTCDFALSPELEVSIDPVLFHRIINNVVVNSLQALAEVDRQKKMVRIEAALKDQKLKIAIQDNGPGLAKENLPQIFEPLYSSKSFGVGLGMTIVKNAVKQMNGDIEIDSTEGAGMSVAITLPV